MPHPRQILPWAKLLALPCLIWIITYLTYQVYSQTTLAPTTADFVISALPLVSEEAPAIDNNLVIWYDDRNGPTDVWAYDLVAQQTFTLTSQRDAQLIADVNGDLVVYEDNRNGTWDLYGLHRSTEEEFLVASGPYHQRYPRVWGEYIVYQDETAAYGESDVYLYHRSTGVTKSLAVAAGYQGKPDIDTNWVVWVDQRTGSTQLGLYNLATGEQDWLPVTCGWECLPHLSGNEVVWSDWRTGDANIHLYNLATKTESVIYAGPGDQLFPDVSPELIVWQDQATFGNWDVFVYVRATQALFPVTTEPSWQIHPAVAGNRVVWQDNRSHNWDIYGFTWQGDTPPLPPSAVANPRNLQVGAYSQGAIQLTWTDNSANEQGFRIERAIGIFSTAWQELAVLTANTTNYTDAATMVGQSYWYRLQAVGAEGNSTYSNEAYSTAIDNVPSADERYLHLLINELRMDPAKWQHPEQAALDPVGWHPNLAYAARAHAVGMNNSNCCQGHVDLAGRGPSERATASGYPHGAAENLFQAQSGPAGMEAAHQGFINSPDHLVNMLDPNTRQLAIGFAPGGRGTLVEVFSGGPTDAGVPVLPSGIVIPYQDKVGSEFDFLVSFASPGQQPPTAATVVIDGASYAMTLQSGQPGRGTYRYRTRLPLGEHRYAFVFSWGAPPQSARLPEQGEFVGPQVRPPQPDLQVAYLRADRLVAEREQQVEIGLTNTGDTAANQITVSLYTADPAAGGQLIGQTTLTRALPPNATQPVTIPWRPATPGAYQLYAWVDSPESIGESDETNNVNQLSMQVREQGRIWYVDGAAAPGGDGLTPARAFTTIPAALEQAWPGDFVRVAAGVYPGPVSLPAGVHLIGAGSTQTTLRGNGQGSVVHLRDQSTLSGFTITGSGPGDWDAGVWIDAAQVATVRNNHITGNSVGVVKACFSPPCVDGSLILNNVIDHQRLAGINIHAVQVQISNNTVTANGDWGIHVDAAGTVVRNNLIVSNKTIGLYVENAAVTVEYNNLWGNGTNQRGATLGTGNLSVDPQWTTSQPGVYPLKATSPCRDAGDPASTHNDVDGSRNDLGAGGGPSVLVAPLPTATPTPPVNATVSPTLTPPPSVSVTPTPPVPPQLRVHLPLVRR